jgi:hypothetical protein
MAAAGLIDAETLRLQEDARRERNWKRWGPYLSERQWGTVREDYSADGDCWRYFPHEHARSRVYRWGEDGLLGITDRECRLCFALALWNGRDAILKERLFGLSGLEGNHGEDVKEEYFYLDATPTHSYLRALYKYPQAEFPYGRLVEENRRRSRNEPEFEIADTGIFNDGRYFDVVAEYAKASPDDIAIRITAANRGPGPAVLHLLPTLWFRNTWSWGRSGEGYWGKTGIRQAKEDLLIAEHATLGQFHLVAGPGPDAKGPAWLFTDNETNLKRLFGAANPSPYVKDAFHDYVVHGDKGAINPARVGSKAAAHYVLAIPQGGEVKVELRLFAAAEAPRSPLGRALQEIFAKRIEEAEDFYRARIPQNLSVEERRVAGKRTRACCGTSSFIIMLCATGSTAIRHSRRRPRRAGRAATATGRTFITVMCCRCRTSGNIPGMPPGTWPST